MSHILVSMEEKRENISRDELYRQVWAEPISKLSASYEVSGSYLARICRELNVPTPGRGYWAKLAAKKAPPKAVLPPLRPGDATMWIRSPSSGRDTDSMPVPPEPRTDIPPKRRSRTPNVLLIDAKELISKAKKDWSSIYQNPRHHKLVDIVTTLEHLEDSLSLAEKLFSRLEDYGYRVLLANGEGYFHAPKIEGDEVIKPKRNDYYYCSLWRPGPCTVAYFGTVAIGLTLIEMQEEIKVRDYYEHLKTVGSRRYRLYAYSPYRYTELVQNWQDTKENKLERHLDEIIAEMEVMARKIPSLILEGERKAAEEAAQREAEYRESQRQQALESRKEAEQDSRDELEQLIADWVALKGRQAFIDELMQAIEQEKGGTEGGLLKKLEIAKSLLATRSVVDLIQNWETPDERFNALPSWKKGEE
jgi:hypothetical protein